VLIIFSLMQSESKGILLVNIEFRFSSKSSTSFDVRRQRWSPRDSRDGKLFLMSNVDYLFYCLYTSYDL
jgi:hypothetical protein